MQKLVSVIICCYRRFQFIYEAIDSVLSQSYGAIELLISDDGSDNFPQKKIQAYINRKKGANIRRVLINHEPENLGTVKHLNHARRLVHGDYIGLLAADDAYYDAYALERFVAGFESLKPEEECYVEIAQTAMCDYTLKRIDGYALFQDVREALEQGGQKLFDLVAYCACLPTTSFFYKKEFFEKYGNFDEDFHLIEDYPMHCRITREGWKIHYENFVAAKHRSGGISHGNVGGLSKSAYWYDQDILKIREKCIQPYYAQISQEALADIRDRSWEEVKRMKQQLSACAHDKELQRQYKKEYRWSLYKDKLRAESGRFYSLAAELFLLSCVLIFAAPCMDAAAAYIKLAGYLPVVISCMYRLGWIFLAGSGICWFIGFLGRMVAKIEDFPWDIERY